MPLVNLSIIIASNVINNRNAQQICPLTIDDDDSSNEEDDNDAKNAKESVLDPSKYMDQINWESMQLWNKFNRIYKTMFE